MIAITLSVNIKPSSGLGGFNPLSYYLRPDGTSYFLRPDGTSRFKRP